MHVLDHCARHERPQTHLRHYSPGDYSLATYAGCGRLFSSSRFWTRPASRPLARFMKSTMDLKLYDTLTREKRVFRPLDPSNVRMYVCGPTVYDFAHIGNARPVIVFDVLFRLLRHLYGEKHVTYVRNITDVDDKINARAAEEYPDLPLNEAIRKVTEKTDRQFHEDVAALGCLPPTVEPRATDHIAEMRTLIERLIKSGNAYVAEDNVLFSVASMPDYGQPFEAPAGRDDRRRPRRSRTLQERPAGFRPLEAVEVRASRRGRRPPASRRPAAPAGISNARRWHGNILGEMFDIHGGGIDLVFPHHENEIAQSRCAFHTPVMANYWMHNGFLQVEGEKMSKSLGNFVTIHELLEDWPGDVIRLTMLQTHYRQPIRLDRNRLARGAKDTRSLVRTNPRCGAGLLVRRHNGCASGRFEYAQGNKRLA